VIYDELPIFKSALDFVVYIETIVKSFMGNFFAKAKTAFASFDKYHKYPNAHIKHANSYRLKNKIGAV